MDGGGGAPGWNFEKKTCARHFLSNRRTELVRAHCAYSTTLLHLLEDLAVHAFRFINRGEIYSRIGNETVEK